MSQGPSPPRATFHPTTPLPPPPLFPPSLIPHLFLSSQNPAVRTKVAAKLDELLAAHGYRMLGNRPLLEAMVGAAVRLVGEAAQDTRTFAKRMLWEARRLLDASGGDFARVLGAKADARARELVLQMFAKEGGPPAAPRPTTRAVLTRNNSGGAGVGAGAGVAPSTAPAMVGEEGRGGRAVRRCEVDAGNGGHGSVVVAIFLISVRVRVSHGSLCITDNKH